MIFFYILKKEHIFAQRIFFIAASTKNKAFVIREYNFMSPNESITGSFIINCHNQFVWCTFIRMENKHLNSYIDCFVAFLELIL